jgi:hypothetical protein
MRLFRKLIDDAMCGSPLAALIAVLMSLQALVGGFGNGAMALASVQDVVICASGGAETHAGHMVGHGSDTVHSGHGAPGDAPHPKHGMDCCLTACQVAASLYAGIPAQSPQPIARIARPSIAVAPMLVMAAAPRELGLSGDARGPPVLPI